MASEDTGSSADQADDDNKNDLDSLEELPEYGPGASWPVADEVINLDSLEDLRSYGPSDEGHQGPSNSHEE